LPVVELWFAPGEMQVAKPQDGTVTPWPCVKKRDRILTEVPEPLAQEASFYPLQWRAAGVSYARA
jgi:hypothetical protein